MCRWNSVLLIHAIIWCLISQIWSCTKRLYKLSSTWAWLCWQSNFLWHLQRPFKTNTIQNSSQGIVVRAFLRVQITSVEHNFGEHSPSCGDGETKGQLEAANGHWFYLDLSFPFAAHSLTCLLCWLCRHKGLSGREGMDTAFYCKPTEWCELKEKVYLPYLHACHAEQKGEKGRLRWSGHLSSPTFTPPDEAATLTRWS